MEAKAWYQQKTFWAGIAGLIAAATGYFTGEVGLLGASQMAIGSLIAIFLRQGVEKLKG